MSTFSTRRYPLGSSSSLRPLRASYSPREDRQLAESTTTGVLDELIRAYPQRLELYRTRGIVRTFLDEYSAAVKDTQSPFLPSQWESRSTHAPQGNKGKGDRRKRDVKSLMDKRLPTERATRMEGDTSESETPPVHPSVLPGAPEPIEPQLLFLRAAAYLQNAIFLIEERILKLEGIRRRISGEGAAELRLCYMQHGCYGGVEIGNPAGPLGKSDGSKLQVYQGVLADDAFREHIGELLKKSIPDHERFLAHFDALGTPPPSSSASVNDDDATPNGDDIVQSAAYAFLLSEALRLGSAGTRHPHRPRIRRCWLLPTPPPW